MTTSDDQDHLDYLRELADGADASLFFAVIDACPGDHVIVQHRDRKAPWCRHCGRTARGVRVKDIKHGEVKPVIRRSVRTIDVTCPTCGAGAAIPCLNHYFFFRNGFHIARIQAAVAADDRKTQP